jgi:hypothetical protein
MDNLEFLKEFGVDKERVLDDMDCDQVISSISCVKVLSSQVKVLGSKIKVPGS